MGVKRNPVRRSGLQTRYLQVQILSLPPISRMGRWYNCAHDEPAVGPDYRYSFSTDSGGDVPEQFAVQHAGRPHRPPGLELNARIDHFGLNARMDRMQADLSQFYQTLGRHDAEIANLKDTQRRA